MAIDWDAIEGLRRRAEAERKRGDRLKKDGDESGAITAFTQAEAALRECLESLQQADPLQTAAARAEALGFLGGILRKMNHNEEALGLYSQGAEVEKKYDLPSTYNRMNHITYTLLTGKSTLGALELEIRDCARTLESLLNNPLDQRAADNAWSWADLGECLTLLGDLDNAERAYRIFIQKADLKTPESTLDVLRKISKALEENDKPAASNVRNAVVFLNSQLA